MRAALCVLQQYGRLLLVGEGTGLFLHSGGEEMRVEGRIDQVTFPISVMIPIIPMLKRCAFAEGKGFLERQCADS